MDVEVTECFRLGWLSLITTKIILIFFVLKL